LKWEEVVGEDSKMTIERNINKISFRQKSWQIKKSVNRIKNNAALDTETIGKEHAKEDKDEGAAFLIASSSNEGTNYLFADDIDSYLQFLTKKEFWESNNWFYNLEYDMGAILKRLPVNNYEQLLITGKTEYNNYKISYIPQKRLRISKNNRKSTFFDLAQFYYFKSLKSLANKTSVNKVDVDDIQDIDIERLDTDVVYKSLIISRCVNDTIITKELADQYTNIINNVVPCNNYISVASPTRQYFLTNIEKNFKAVSKPLMDFALKSYHGGMVEALKMGMFKNVFNIDIVSAYPYTMSNLYLPEGETSTVPEYLPDTAYSFYEVEIDYYDDHISPIWFLCKNQHYHPNGTLKTVITQTEYEFFVSKGFNVKILKARHLLKNKDHERPFYQIINDLFDKRRKAKDDGDESQLVYKFLLNSAYGCTISTTKNYIQCPMKVWNRVGANPDHISEVDGKIFYYIVKEEASNMYNPLFASYITAGCRMQVINTIWKYRNKVISLNTDGIYLSKKIPIKDSKKLGGWESKKLDKFLAFGNGRYNSYDKNGKVDPDNSKFRGLPNAKKNSQLMEDQRKTNLKANNVSLTQTKPLKQRECRRRGCLEKVNFWVDELKEFGYESNKRYWYDEICTNADLYDKQIDSRPFYVNELM